MITDDTIRKLSALCKRWDELDEQKRDIEAQNTLPRGGIVHISDCRKAHARPGGAP